MDMRDAIELLRSAITHKAGVWADLGAGTGTFTRALADTLGRSCTVYAVDANPSASRALVELAARDARIIPVKADFTGPLELPGLRGHLDGVLLANALHFLPDAVPVLARWVGEVRPGGRVIVVEYDRRGADQWVPHPISASRWPKLAAAAGLTDATITASRPSAYSGMLYVGTAIRPREVGFQAV